MVVVVKMILLEQLTFRSAEKYAILRFQKSSFEVQDALNYSTDTAKPMNDFWNCLQSLNAFEEQDSFGDIEFRKSQHKFL